MGSMEYKVVEIAVTFKNGMASGKAVKRLTTAMAQEEMYSPRWKQLRTAQMQFKENTTDINCLANYIPGLRKATTVVHIPRISLDGKALSPDHIQYIYWQVCATYGVPNWTQSSIKNITLYMVRTSQWKILTEEWDDAYKWTNYGPLVFSSMTDEKPTKFKVNKIQDAGVLDGNCAVNPAVWDYKHGCLARWMQHKGPRLLSTGKGKGDIRKDEPGIALNDSQVKYHARTGRGTWYMLKNTDINSERNITWFAPQIPLMLRDCPEVRQWTRARVKNAIDKYVLQTLRDPLKRALRRGALKVDELANGKYKLRPARSAQEEAFRCAIDNCVEIEQRSGRFLVRDAARIALAGGVNGKRSLITISEDGVSMITREEALELIAQGKPVWMLYRDPVNAPKRIVFLPEDPYREGQGYVVTPETAAAMNADSDGDTGNMCNDQKAVKFYAEFLRDDLEVEDRPTPIRRTAPLTIDKVEDIGLEMINNSWVIGSTTIAAWKLMQAGYIKEAALMLLFADTAPMIIKHFIYIGGKPFMQAVRALLKKMKTVLDSTTLKWHDAMVEAKEWDSIKDFANSIIENPISHMDMMWNAGAEEVAKWLKDNPLYELSLSKTAHSIFETHGDIPTSSIHGVNTGHSMSRTMAALSTQTTASSSRT